MRTLAKVRVGEKGGDVGSVTPESVVRFRQSDLKAVRVLRYDAWKEAEEIAAIADNLLLPARTDEFFDRHGKTS